MRASITTLAIFAISGFALANPEYEFDFNSLSLGNLNNKLDDSPNIIGRWSTASSVPDVVSGNLSAPGGTNYAFSPSITTPRRANITRSDTAYRAQFHEVVSVNGGVIWASVLLRADSQSAAAVAFDGELVSGEFGWTLQTRPGFGIRPDSGSGNTELFWSDNLTNLTSNQSSTLTADYSNQTVLLLARINFGTTLNNVEIWVNPTLSTIPALGAPDLTATTTRSSMDHIGIGAVDTGVSGHDIDFDNFLISSDSQEEIAFANVTGLAPVLTPGQVSIQYDFNNLNTGADLKNQTDDSGNDLGVWTGGSFVPNVASDDLTAPSSTNYGLSPGGLSGRAIATRTDDAYRAQFHEIQPADGIMWFSTLLQADSSSAVAIGLEGAATALGFSGVAGFGIRPDSSAGNTQLFWSDNLNNLTGAQTTTIPTDYSEQTVLLVGRIDFGAASNQVDIWLNPSLTTRSALGTTGDLEATTSLASMQWIGVGAVDDGSDGYNIAIDNVLFNNNSDEDTAFDAVTAVLPPPLPPSFTQADINANGIPDYAELLYPSISFLPLNADSDGDGSDNQSEAIAGTDPLDPTSLLKIIDFVPDANPPTQYTVTFSSSAGKRYHAETSDSLDSSSWSDTGTAVTASGGLSTMICPANEFPSSETGFIRIKTLPDIDTDSDGLEDALEEYLGYSTTNIQSVREISAGGDLQQLTNLMMGGNPQGGMFGTSSAGVPSDENASRFLAQATWGPTTASIASLQALGNNAYEQWIDQQIALSPSYTRTYMDYLAARRASDYSSNWGNLPHYMSGNSDFAFFRENLNSGWMRIMLFGDDQLRQRTAWALSQIVVIGPRCNSFALAAADWYDTVIEHSLGSYRDLLYEVSIHPWMGWWLSHIGNEKAAQVGTTSGGDPVLQMPDENFAREIMQLFSIGLWELNMDGTRKLDINGDPIPTYTNEDITQVARVFTGLDAQSGVSGRAIYSTAPMQMYESDHDDGSDFLASIYQKEVGGVPEPLSEAGKKRFLGHELPRFIDDPGRTGLDDVNDTVDILFNHPSCPPFICKNLIQHLVTSNPTPAYVERVSNVFADDGTGTRGNLAAVVKAILLDPEARDLASALDTSAGRLKGPMLRTVHMARATSAGSGSPALYDDTGIQFWDPRKDVMFGDFLEYPHESPSVFNFYEPGYSRPGEIRDNDLLSPEFQIMNTLTTTTIPNRLLYFIQNGMHRDTKNNGVTPDFTLQMGPLQTLSNQGTEELVDHLNLIFAHGFVGAEARAELINRVNFYLNSSANADERAELALFLSIISAEGSVLK